MVSNVNDYLSSQLELHNCISVTGPAGAGKTQLVMDFLGNFTGNKQCIIRQFNASTKETLSNDYYLFLSEFFRKINKNINKLDDEICKDVIKAIFDFQDANVKIIFFFDNMSAWDGIADWIPKARQGRHIIMTALDKNILRSTHNIGYSVPLEGFLKDEAYNFLKDVVPDEIEANTLASTFNNLPLGITCAKLYLQYSPVPISVKEYLKLISDEEARIEVEFLEDEFVAKFYLDKKVGQRSQLAACQALIEQLDEEAVELLRTCAFLAPDAIIPNHLITSSLKRTLKTESTITAAFLNAKRNTILRHLEQYAIVNQQQSGITVHRVMQDATLIYTKKQFNTGKQNLSRQHVFIRAIPAPADAYWMQSTAGSDALRLGLAPHLRAIYEHPLFLQEQNDLQVVINKARILNCLSDSYGIRNDYAKKKVYGEKARQLLQGREEVPALKTKAHILTNLSHAYYGLGRTEEQITCLNEALTIKEKYYADTPETIAKTEIYLAQAYIELEQYSEAARLLAKAQPVYSNNLVEMASIQIELARISIHENRLLDAATLLQAAKKTFSHPDTYSQQGLAITLRYLGMVSFQEGLYGDAIGYLGSAIELHKSSLGYEFNVSTVLTQQTLAQVYFMKEDYKVAHGYALKAGSFYSSVEGGYSKNKKLLNRLLKHIEKMMKQEVKYRSVKYVCK